MPESTFSLASLFAKVLKGGAIYILCKIGVRFQLGKKKSENNIVLRILNDQGLFRERKTLTTIGTFSCPHFKSH